MSSNARRQSTVFSQSCAQAKTTADLASEVEDMKDPVKKEYAESLLNEFREWRSHYKELCDEYAELQKQKNIPDPSQDANFNYLDYLEPEDKHYMEKMEELRKEYQLIKDRNVQRVKQLQLLSYSLKSHVDKLELMHEFLDSAKEKVCDKAVKKVEDFIDSAFEDAFNSIETSDNENDTRLFRDCDESDDNLQI